MRLHLRRDARRDIERAADWFAVEAPEQVPRFFAQVDAATARILFRPLLARVLRADARRVHLKVYPYELWYLVHEDLALIEVVALVHDRQDPSTMLARLGPTQ